MIKFEDDLFSELDSIPRDFGGSLMEDDLLFGNDNTASSMTHRLRTASELRKRSFITPEEHHMMKTLVLSEDPDLFREFDVLRNRPDQRANSLLNIKGVLRRHSEYKGDAVEPTFKIKSEKVVEKIDDQTKQKKNERERIRRSTVSTGFTGLFNILRLPEDSKMEKSSVLHSATSRLRELSQEYLALKKENMRLVNNRIN